MSKPLDSSLERPRVSETRPRFGLNEASRPAEPTLDELAALDALLELGAALPAELPLDQLATRFADKLAALLPGLAVCVRLAAPLGAEAVQAERTPAKTTSDVKRSGLERAFPLGDAHSVLRLTTYANHFKGAELRVAERAAKLLACLHERARLSARNERLNAHLMNAEKLASLGRIVAGVVHELNNPLTGILAGTSVLVRRLQQPSPEGRQQDIERVQRIADAAERILSFTRDLVAYARPLPAPLQPVRLKEVIDRAVLFCEHEFSTCGVTVERGYTQPLPELLGVGDQLTQVFVNLFTNAVHAMAPRGGSLEVRARVADSAQCLEVAVRDSGEGIPEELLPQVFEPFFTTKPRGHGTGLGLSIVRDIVAAHRGSVEVRSQRGVGTTFELSLPLPQQRR